MTQTAQYPLVKEPRLELGVSLRVSQGFYRAPCAVPPYFILKGCTLNFKWVLNMILRYVPSFRGLRGTPKSLQSFIRVRYSRENDEGCMVWFKGLGV